MITVEKLNLESIVNKFLYNRLKIYQALFKLQYLSINFKKLVETIIPACCFTNPTFSSNKNPF